MSTGVKLFLRIEGVRCINLKINQRLLNEKKKGLPVKVILFVIPVVQNSNHFLADLKLLSEL
ncbi:hypothetical protein DC498_21225 [Terrimonas sp.]|nr:hypothetical protein DC498_21225 [Terrimonas sp.]